MRLPLVLPHARARCDSQNAFHTCTSLTSVTIPDSVTEMGQVSLPRAPIWPPFVHALTRLPLSVCRTRCDSQHVFAGCKSLTSATTPDSVRVHG